MRRLLLAIGCVTLFYTAGSRAQDITFVPSGAFTPDVKIVDKFDRNGDKRLDAEERRAARAALLGVTSIAVRRISSAVTTPGERLSPSDVKPVSSRVPVFDPGTIRTIFLQFDEDDWDAELAAFYGTDVDVPATMMVDGKTFKDVGVHYRGNSSYRMVPAGYKHSINLTLDFVHEKQDFGGYNSFNLLNANNDPSFIRTLMYAEIARHYLPIAKVNFVRVVINGESWGIYVSVQQVDKDFVEEWYHTRDGGRWRAPGSPRGRSGLEYLGDDPAPYRRLFEIKSSDNPGAWADLIRLCKVLNQTPADALEAALAPLLDVDETLRFLAVEVALVNSDGYWTRASDYNLYQDPSGRFHVIPHDFNEGFGGEQRGFGALGSRASQLDPLSGIGDGTKPLRSKLLAVPALRARYLGYVRDIATRWLDWQTFGPLADKYQALISAEVQKDTRKLYSFDRFQHGVIGSNESSVKTFVERRREYLLKP
jgi:hypothetical protein